MTFLRECWHRLWGVLRGNPTDHDLEYELLFHVEQAEEELRRKGHSPAEAARLARVRLGGFPQVMEALRDQHGLPWLDALWTDLRIAARTLLRSPGFSLTALLTLVVGMSATTLALTAVNAVLLKPLSVRAPDRVVGITTVGELAVLGKEPVGFGDYADLARDVAAFESVVAHRRMGSVVGTGLDRRIAIGEQVSPDYFTTLGVSFPLGRPFDEADQPGAVVVLGHAAWRRHFGTDPRIIGRELAIGDRRRTVVGIAPVGFTGLFRGVAPEFWQPLDDAGGESADDRGQLEWWVHARLRDDATLEQARTQVAVLADTLSRRYPHSNAGRSFALTPLSEASIHPVVSKALARFGAAGVLAVALLLLLVCSVNVAHLVLARAVDGQREVAIRLAVGASRWRIIRPLLAEGILLAGVAAAIALLLTAWVGPMLGDIRLPGVPTAIDLHLVPDWRVFGLTVIVVLGSTMVSSLGPALRISSGLSIVKTLKTDSRSSAAGGATTWRMLLIAGQAGTAVLLLVVGGLALRSLLAVTQVDPGFETRGVAVASVAPALVGRDQDEAYRYLSRAAAAVRELPDVEAAGWIQPVPLSLSVRLTRLRLSGHDGVASHELPLVDVGIAGPGAFRALRVPVIEGREFDASDRSGAVEVSLVNEAFVRRFWPDRRQAIGQHIGVGFPETRTVEVAGVVGDFKNRTLGDVTRPMVFTSILQDPLGWQAASLVMRRSPVGPPQMVHLVDAMRAIDPAVPVFDVQPLTARIGGVLLLPRYAATVLGGTGVLALGLVVLGLYGTVSLSVRLRLRELSLRMALGSSRTAIVRLVMRQALAPVVVGVVFGLVVALGATRVLTALLYGVSPHDPATLVAAALTLLTTTTAAGAYPAWRATRTNLMRSLQAG